MYYHVAPLSAHATSRRARRRVEAHHADGIPPENSLLLDELFPKLRLSRSLGSFSGRGPIRKRDDSKKFYLKQKACVK